MECDEQLDEQLFQLRQTITRAIWQAIGPDKGTHVKTVQHLGSVWLYNPHVRRLINEAIDETYSMRIAGRITKTAGGYLVAIVKRICHERNVNWPGDREHKVALYG